MIPLGAEPPSRHAFDTRPQPGRPIPEALPAPARAPDVGAPGRPAPVRHAVAQEALVHKLRLANAVAEGQDLPVIGQAPLELSDAAVHAGRRLGGELTGTANLPLLVQQDATEQGQAAAPVDPLVRLDDIISAQLERTEVADEAARGQVIQGPHVANKPKKNLGWSQKFQARPAGEPAPALE